MAGILKIFYIAIIYVSLFLVVIEDERECVTDADCQKKYPGPYEHLLKCVSGYCVGVTG
ncbi:Nodule Cysteine-Rich (NCR) secreted peptide [Medicago truncatula]|uniref:Nodule Cysteine-Rich (NCR) secreted peptide n=2 Tax=Medicago truncatula TaxID=3880 RepID=A0A072UJP9_MEDTR|nr:Nodule Cysteine-Rich (NCR) secreted peptide [Medicago truncatula]